MARKKITVSEHEVISLVRSKAQVLLRQPNITSVGVGYKIKDGKTTNELSIQFTVGSKLAPETLEAEKISPLPLYFEMDNGEKVPVDVIERNYQANYEIVSDPETEKRAAEQSSREKYRSRHDPIRPGISISHINGTAGTIGAIVYDKNTGQPYILSNWHVFHGSNGDIGDPIVQPGPFDDSTVDNNTMGSLVRSHIGLAGDCAISSINGRGFSEQILGLDVTPKRTAKVNIGDKTVKSGRTTGVTHGIVRRVGVVVKINYGGSIGVQQIGGFEIAPNPKKLAPNGEISMGGDSGSLWLIDGNDEDSDIAVGLHFAGETDPLPSAEHAIACNIHSVFDKLNIAFTENNELTFDDEELWNEVLGKLDSLSSRLDRLEQTRVSPDNAGCSCDKMNSNTRIAEGLPVYGNWCGPGHGGGNPVDDVDRACMTHDNCYGNKGYFDCDCDAELIQNLDKAILSSNVKPTGRMMAPIIRGWFSHQPCVYHVGGVPIPGGTGGSSHTVRLVTRRGKKVWKKIRSWF